MLLNASQRHRLRQQRRSPQNKAVTIRELLPLVNQILHQDRLQSIYILLVGVANEEGCDCDTTEIRAFRYQLPRQMTYIQGYLLKFYEDREKVLCKKISLM
jgi:predicted secreted protein